MISFAQLKDESHGYDTMRCNDYTLHKLLEALDAITIAQKVATIGEIEVKVAPWCPENTIIFTSRRGDLPPQIFKFEIED